ncbi:MAG: DUF2157 domain-containing protein [Thermodesulfovibrionales bacterium]|jgi:uncharacterized membrane protein
MKSHRNLILQWAEQGHLAAGRAEEAMRVSGALPDRGDWHRFIDRLLLWSGTVSVAAGGIFFFAYNWQEMGDFARFGLVELLIAVAVVCCLRFGMDNPAGKASLLAASVFAGALLALFGQTYQTGADTFDLFVTWAVAILPWTAVGRLPVLWILLTGLVNIAITLYFHAFPSLFGLLFGTEEQLWLLFGFNSFALLLWEFFSRHVVWLRERWAVRLLGLADGGLVTALALMAIFDDNVGFNAAFIVYPLWLAAIYVSYRRIVFDLFMLAGAVLSVVIVVAAILGRVLLEGGDSGIAYLFIGLAVIGLSALGGLWLKKISREEGR